MGPSFEFMLACRDMEAVRRDLEAARSEIMGPLSAASMESHSRAYPHLVQLHMLQVVHCQPACFASLRGLFSSQRVHVGMAPFLY